MPTQISKTDEKIKNLLSRAEGGDAESIKDIYELALTDKKISKLNSLNSDNLSPLSILLENQIEVKSGFDESGLSKVERKEFEISDYSAIAWILHEIYREPSAPYTYALAKRMMDIKNIGSAQKWYVTAAIMARIDASKCEDKTAPQGILIIESEFSNIKKTLQNQSDFQEAIKFALEQEEKFKNRPLPKWICSHGIKAFSGELKYKDEELWQKERGEIRARYEAKLTETKNLK